MQQHQYTPGVGCWQRDAAARAAIRQDLARFARLKARAALLCSVGLPQIAAAPPGQEVQSYTCSWGFVFTSKQLRWRRRKRERYGLGSERHRGCKGCRGCRRCRWWRGGRYVGDIGIVGDVGDAGNVGDVGNVEDVSNVRDVGELGEGSQRRTHVHAVDFILHWLCQQRSLSVLRIYFLVSQTQIITLIRREWGSKVSTVLTTQLLWKHPAFSFQWHEIISVFCCTHFFNPFSFVFTCWPCTKKPNLTSSIFSAKKVSVPGLNVSCSQIKGKKHKGWHILFISWFTSVMFLSTLFGYYCWCFAHNVALASQKCLSPTDKYSY